MKNLARTRRTRRRSATNVVTGSQNSRRSWAVSHWPLTPRPTTLLSATTVMASRRVF